MIQDVATLTEIRNNWAGVEALRDRFKRSLMESMPSSPFVYMLADGAHNLPFLHAFAVLNDALEQLAHEGHFRYQGRELGRLVNDSKQALPWHNFDLVKEGLRHRNAVAHKGILLGRGECWKYIDAIKVELSDWAGL